MKPDYQSANIAYWTLRAPSYSRQHQTQLETRQHAVWQSLLAGKLAAHFPDRPPEDIHILDVGTGPGLLAILLAELGCRVNAVDYSQAMLTQAEENAGALASQITFRQMDAEALDFPAESFDALVSRNLTWNLPNPANAYGQWSRVLKKGGLLLNFDANWYRYLYDTQAKCRHLQDRQNVAQSHMPDDTAGTDVNAMEAIARQAPLSGLMRPKWDLEVLSQAGMTATADANIWRQVWTDAERVNHASTPMFLVQAVKA